MDITAIMTVEEIIEYARDKASKMVSQMSIGEGLITIMNIYAYSHTKTGPFANISDAEQDIYDAISLAVINELLGYERIA